MLAISIVGYAKSGKTSLVKELATYFETQGLKLGIVKFSHHDLDKPNTDTSRFMAPNRTIIGLKTTEPAETLVHWSKNCFLPDLIPLMDCDLLMVEGGKSLTWLPRIICINKESDLSQLEALHPELAIASYGLAISGLKNFTALSPLAELGQWILSRAFSLPGLNCKACGHANCGGLAEQIIQGHAKPNDCPSSKGQLQVEINGSSIALNPFTQNMLAGGLKGMLSALKGYQPGQKVTITLNN